MNERNLIAELKSPETRNVAFDKLVRAYQKVLYYHIRRMVQSHDDTDDILQNVFISVWRNIEKFREESSLKTWLYRIATNESLTFLANQKKRGFQDLEQMENSLGHSTNGNGTLGSEEILQKLQMAINELPEKQKLVFNMRYYDELSFRDISEILGTSEGGLKANYHHAVNKIEAFLTQEK
jgi:RNA polymerase sigma-70 factor (ECF subfamily)